MPHVVIQITINALIDAFRMPLPCDPKYIFNKKVEQKKKKKKEASCRTKAVY